MNIPTPQSLLFALFPIHQAQALVETLPENWTHIKGVDVADARCRISQLKSDVVFINGQASTEDITNIIGYANLQNINFICVLGAESDSIRFRPCSIIYHFQKRAQWFGNNTWQWSAMLEEVFNEANAVGLP